MKNKEKKNHERQLTTVLTQTVGYLNQFLPIKYVCNNLDLIRISIIMLCKLKDMHTFIKISENIDMGQT